MTIEKRAALEMRAEGRKLVGYAAVFNQSAQIADFHETIAPGSFRRSLAGGKDVLALVDHNPSNVLARTKSGTLRLQEDDRGLRFEIDVPDTQLGKDVLALATRGDLGGCSFGFTVDPDGEEWRGDQRLLKSVSLVEISIVHSFPAYGGTSVQARSRRTEADRRIALLELEGLHVAV